MLHSEEAQGTERSFPCYYSLQPIHPSPHFGDLDKYDSIQFVTHQSLILHCQEFIISRLACAIKMHLLISAHLEQGVDSH